MFSVLLTCISFHSSDMISYLLSYFQLSSKLNEEDFIHMTLVRRLQDDEATMVLSYAAFKLLDLDISLDRK